MLLVLQLTLYGLAPIAFTPTTTTAYTTLPDGTAATTTAITHANMWIGPELHTLVALGACMVVGVVYIPGIMTIADVSM